MNEETNASSLEEFLENEIATIERSTRKTWIGGILFGLFLVGYLNFSLFMLHTFLDPKNAAILIVAQVEENAPAFLADTEQALRNKAPMLAEEVSVTFIKSIPKVRRMAQEQIALAHRELIPYLSWEFQMMLRTYIQENSLIIQEIAGEGDINAFADQFTRALLDQFAERLDESLAEEYGGRDLKFVRENLLFALESMNEYLTYLTKQDPKSLNHREILQRRILAVVTRRVIEGKPE